MKKYGQTMRQATLLAGTKPAPSTNVPPLTERAAAEKFSAVVLPFSSGQLAQAANRSKETAKGWKNGRAFPNGASLINMARQLPQIRSWLYAEIGRGAAPETMELDTPQAIAVIFRGLQRLAAAAGTEGDEARGLLAMLTESRQ